MRGANITQDKEAGHRTLERGDLKRAITSGHVAEWRTARPDLCRMALECSLAISTQSSPTFDQVAPVSNKVPTPVYKAAMHVDIPLGAEKQITASDLDTPVKRGFYLATIAHCMECHTPMVVNDRHDFVNDLGKGGEELQRALRCFNLA